ncbi:MAG TPA: hypothetical protein VE030_11295 [Burkholderiales bacterium]|nr:hypothetical protein [Burkholderiales bacterium]
MERSFRLLDYEAEQQTRMEQELQNTLANYGALTLQLEAVKARIPQVEERQRTFVGQVAARANAGQFQSARIANGHLICTVPDEPMGLPNPVPAGLPVLDSAGGPVAVPEHRAAEGRKPRVNGPDQISAKE